MTEEMQKGFEGMNFEEMGFNKEEFEAAQKMFAQMMGGFGNEGDHSTPNTAEPKKEEVKNEA